MKNDELPSDCGRVRNELASLLYDELAPEAHARISTHLVGCEPCRDELQALGDTRALLSRWETPRVEDDERELARTIAARARTPEPVRPHSARWVRWVAVVSGAAAAGLFTLSLLNARVSSEQGRFELSFGFAAPTAAPASLSRDELRTVVAQEVAQRAEALQQDQQALVQRLLALNQQELLRLSQAVDLALAQNQETWNTRLLTLGQEAARADIETRQALTSLASYLPAFQSGR
jgi:hypothetical protein